MRPDKILSRSKRPSEEFRLSWDFVNDVEAGDSGSAFEVKAFDASNADTDVSTTFLQNASRSDKVVSVQVQAGTADHDYDVRFQLTTAGGDVFQRIVRIRVGA
jgi:hypothetical protein